MRWRELWYTRTVTCEGTVQAVPTANLTLVTIACEFG